MNLAKAWDITIKKWGTEDKPIYYFTQAANCGLCQKFLVFYDNPVTGESVAKCSGCPIAQITKHKACDRFPAYKKLISIDVLSGHANTPEVEKVRQQGLAWLLNIKEKHEELVRKKLLAKFKEPAA